MNSTNKYRGFTLIELLIAIAIIAVITAIMMGNFSGSRIKARDATRISDVAQIQLALQLFYDRCGQYPSTITVSSTSSSCPSGVTLGTYISQVPTPPAGASQSSYDYATLTSSGNIVNYVIHATLEANNAAVAKGLSAMPSGTWSASYTCSNASNSTNYCVTSN